MSDYRRLYAAGVPVGYLLGVRPTVLDGRPAVEGRFTPYAWRMGHCFDMHLGLGPRVTVGRGHGRVYRATVRDGTRVALVPTQQRRAADPPGHRTLVTTDGGQRGATVVFGRGRAHATFVDGTPRLDPPAVGYLDGLGRPLAVDVIDERSCWLVPTRGVPRELLPGFRFPAELFEREPVDQSASFT